MFVKNMLNTAKNPSLGGDYYESDEVVRMISHVRGSSSC